MPTYGRLEVDTSELCSQFERLEPRTLECILGRLESEFPEELFEVVFRENPPAIRASGTDKITVGVRLREGSEVFASTRGAKFG